MAASDSVLKIVGSGATRPPACAVARKKCKKHTHKPGAGKKKRKKHHAASAKKHKKKHCKKKRKKKRK